MRGPFLLSGLLLLAACASGGGATRTIDVGDAGAAITISVIDVEGTFGSLPSTITVHIEVLNLADYDVIVDRVTVGDRTGGVFEILTASVDANELISDGEDHTFVLRTTGHMRRQLEMTEARRVILEVRVTLTNGDTYRAMFEVPVRTSHI